MQSYPVQGQMPPGMAGAAESDQYRKRMNPPQKPTAYMAGKDHQDRRSNMSFIQQALQETGASGEIDTPEGRQSAMLEFARENLLLKRELHQINSDISHIKKILQGIPLESSTPDEESESERDSESTKSHRRYWTNEEHERFLEAIQVFGIKNVKAVSTHVGSRSVIQVRTHAQKYFLKLARTNKYGRMAPQNVISTHQRAIGNSMQGDLFLSTRPIPRHKF